MDSKDTKMSREKTELVVYRTKLPGKTNMTLCGDPYVIKQIVEMINGKFVKLRKKEDKGWSSRAVAKINAQNNK